MNPIQKQQKKELEEIEICTDILKNARDELYLAMRFFDVVLSRFEFMPDVEMEGIGTDGFAIYFYPDFIIGLYRSAPVRINRVYLHMVLHCLFGHLKPQQGLEARYWNLACDIVVESILDDLKYRCIRHHIKPYRKAIYQQLKIRQTVLSPKGVYRELQNMNLEEETFQKMEQEFFADHHMRWNQKIPPEKAMERERQWREQNERLQTELETFSKEAAEGAESLVNQIQVENRQRYDYRKFLEKFSILKEELEVDQDSFDYVFYHYGMEMYGNMPLIEPQETKELRKIEDFVVVVDTSMSCKEELIKKFLEETFSILSKSESFFRKINIHIIQCDDKIQEDYVITNHQELQDYMEHFEVKGFGGTDFRPAFGYVNQLLKKKAFHRLKGLIYFTDGYGTFPVKRPNYETAFIFLKEDYRDIDVPVWAIKLIIEPEELEKKGGQHEY